MKEIYLFTNSEGGVDIVNLGLIDFFSLSTYVHPGIACLASQSSDWLGALWASLSGIQSSVTFVRLNVIGHC